MLQYDGNSYCGDVVLDIVNMASKNEDWSFYDIKRNAYVDKSSTKKHFCEFLVVQCTVLL